ncbi:FtsX-like permease family protein [Kocuria sp. ZOR0020]|uniref:FtsX-like permease family protein n=1 Tax=Kocuria sp. ZOR0020 TaxID=1339234 RepID=UPI00064833A9|nr:ABC transporter permease [Kocuria sp. ZOR0020]
MRRIVLSRLRLQWARYVLITLCVAVSAAFATASMMLNSTMNASLVSSIAEGTKNADLVATPKVTTEGVMDSTSYLTVEQAHDFADLDGVDSVWPAMYTYTAVEGQSSLDGGLSLAEAPEDSTLFPWKLTEGDFPTQDGQVLLTSSRAESLGLAVGDTITVQSTEYYDGMGATEPGDGTASVDPESAGSMAPGDLPTDMGQLQPPQSVQLTVTGLADVPEMSSFVHGWVTTSQFQEISPMPYDDLGVGSETQIRLADGADLETVRQELNQSLENQDLSMEVLTPQEQSDRILEQISGESNVMLAFLLAFALLAAIVAFLVITTTFGVLTAQRARELALLRCLGATGPQIRRSVILEALVIGLIASTLGIAATVGIGFALGHILPEWVVVAVSLRDILAGLALGVVVTLLASLGPARRAMQASPLDGMRGSRTSDRLPALRTVFGVLLLLGGAGTLTWAAVVQDQAVAGIVAGAATGVGLILTSRLWMPTVVSGLGKLLPGKTASTLAAANASRHPGRTTTTATALLIGITLVTTVLTGHAVAQRSILEHLDERTPVDITITHSVDDQTLGMLGNQPNVVGVERVDGETHVDLEQGISGRSTSASVAAIADLTDSDQYQIGSVAMEKATYVDILNIMLGVALGLLGASVLVSVLGIASTMSLSVLERTRENSLLRALGLSRRQLASTIRREALLIAAAACLAGVAAGWLLGTAVVRSMVTDSVPVLLTVPWVGLTGVVVGGWLTAMLAAALPTLRATRVSPVEGLASID